MRRTTVFIATCLAASWALGPSVARGTLWTTTGAPPSDMELTFSIAGNPAGPYGSLAATSVSPANVDVTPTSLSFVSSEFLLSDENDALIDAGALGTALVDFQGIQVAIVSDPIPVSSGTWNLDMIGAPSSMVIALNAGTIYVHDPTALIAGLFPSGFVIDLSASPIVFQLSDLLGNGVNGTATSTDVSVHIPDLAWVINSDFDVKLHVISDPINLVPVPEPGSLSLCFIGLVGWVLLGRHRLRKPTTAARHAERCDPATVS